MQVVFFGALFLTYFLTQARHLFGGDSAEFSLVAQTWSIPHPPGYALYSIILNTVRSFFWFVPSYITANLPSIVFTLLSVLCLYEILRFLRVSRYAAVAALLTYGTTSVVWLYAIVPEVYALTSFFIAFITLCVLRLERKPTPRNVFLVSLFVVLGVFHHLSILIYIPGWLVILKKRLPSILRKYYVQIVSAAALGLLPLVYYPVASHFNPPLDWENARTIEGFVRLITRASYGSFQAYVASVPNFLNQYVQLLSASVIMIQFLKPLGLILVFWGFRDAYRKKKNIFSFLIVSIVLYITYLFMTNFSLETPFIVGIFERYLIGLLVLLAVPLAMGIDALGHDIGQLVARLSEKLIIRRLANITFVTAISAFFALHAFNSYSSVSYVRDNRKFDIFAEDILATPPKDVIVSIKGDISYFTTTYRSVVLGERKDISYVFTDLMDRPYYRQRVMTKYPAITLEKSPAFNLERFLRANAARGIYFEKPKQIGYWVPYGLLWKFYPDHKSLETDMDAVIAANNRLWNGVYRIPRIGTKERKILFIDALNDLYLDPLHSYTQFLYTYKKYDLSLHYTFVILGYNPFSEPAITTYAKIRAITNTCPGAMEDIAKQVPAMKGARQRELVERALQNYCAASARGR